MRQLEDDILVEATIEARIPGPVLGGDDACREVELKASVAQRAVVGAVARDP